MKELIQKGQLIAFSEGEYSDYCVEALCKAVADFDLSEWKEKWYSEHCYERESNFYKNTTERRIMEGGVGFLPYLVINGLCEDVEYIEVHTGSYGEADIGIIEY